MTTFNGLKLPSFPVWGPDFQITGKANIKWVKPKLVVLVHAASGTIPSLAKEYDWKKKTLYTFKVNANEHAWSACWSWILVAWHIRYENKQKTHTKTWTIFILILLSFNLLLLMCLLAEGTFVLCVVYFCMYVLWQEICGCEDVAHVPCIFRNWCALCMFNIFIIANQYCFEINFDRHSLSKLHFAMMVTSQNLSCNFLGTLDLFSIALCYLGYWFSVTFLGSFQLKEIR